MPKGTSISWVFGMAFIFAIATTAGAIWWNEAQRPESGVLCPDYVWQEIEISPSSQALDKELIDRIADQYAEHGCRHMTQGELDTDAGWHPLNIAPFTILGAILGATVALRTAEVRAEQTTRNEAP